MDKEVNNCLQKYKVMEKKMRTKIDSTLCRYSLIIGLILFFAALKANLYASALDKNTVKIKTGKGTIEVTYIANSGFLIEMGNKKILIDALFKNGLNYYPAPSLETRNNMVKGIAPFNNINLVLTTHFHPDHCDAEMMTDFLKNNPSAFGVATALAIKGMKFSETTNSKSPKFISITPDLYSSLDTTLNGIKLKVLRLRHSGSDGKEENVGFLVKVAGLTIFHSGDSDGNLNDGNTGKTTLEEYKDLGLANENIDVAFLNRGVFGDSTAPGIEIVRQCIKAKNIVLYHFSENDKQGELPNVKKIIEGVQKDYSEIVIFKQLMEKKVFTN
ncbi:MAG: hypothetical protein C0412_07350 [Flavobacterium sp.]|nr:hypothetical protein [Flavobacterium sp.]